MTRFDAEHDTVSDSEVHDAVQGFGRLVERNALAVKFGAVYAASFLLGLVAYRFLNGPNVEAIVAIWLWFTVIFAACTALLGTVVKTLDAIQRRRHDFE